MTREEKIAELNLKAAKYRRQAANLEVQQNDEVARPKLRTSVGKCFKYNNGYNGTERWPMYIKIVSFNEKDLNFTTIQFQHTTRRIVEIEYEKVYNYRGESRFLEPSSYQPITLAEFNRAKRSALRFVQELLAR